MDHVMIVQEAVHSFGLKKGKIGNLLIKHDLEKAYDRIEWGFVHKILTWFNFLDLWVDIILSCLSTVSSAILVNGNVTDFFNPSHGIRQGNPLSPYIFILCLEYLSVAINEKCRDGSWKPVFFSRRGVPLTHLFFADDLVLFGRVDVDTCTTITLVLEEFCGLSGQKINFNKSRFFYSSNVSEDSKMALSNVLNIAPTTNLGFYFGCPIHHTRPNKRTFQFLIDKVRAKLACWKRNCLSLAGQVTLVKLVNMAIPTYIMQCNLLPISMSNKLDKINRNFIWGSSETKRKTHAVKWSKVVKDKSLGGLKGKHSVHG